MQVHYSHSFLKSFLKRIPKNSSLEKKYNKRLILFIEDKRNPILKDHKLAGTLKNSRAFSIAGDMRIIYVENSKDSVTFVDIGTHNQVYS